MKGEEEGQRGGKKRAKEGIEEEGEEEKNGRGINMLTKVRIPFQKLLDYYFTCAGGGGTGTWDRLCACCHGCGWRGGRLCTSVLLGA